MAEILIPLAFFSSIFGIVYIVMKTRNMERMAMIEKGIDLKQFQKKNKNTTLREGLLGIGVAIGIIVGAILKHNTILNQEAYFASIFLFAGLALLTSDFIQRKRDKEDR